MSSITSYKSNQLLDEQVVVAVEAEAARILAAKDVAAAWQGANHLKKELSVLPAARLAGVLPRYRPVSASLKALALPLLDEAEVKNLLAKNLSQIDTRWESYIASGLKAWLAAQPAATRPELAALLVKSVPAKEARLALVKSALAIVDFNKAVTNNLPPHAPPSPPSGRGGDKIVASPQGEGVGADGFFDKDEEDEIAGHIEKANALAGALNSQDPAAAAAVEIATLVKTAVEPARLKDRVHVLVLSRLRDVRTAAEINEYLARPFPVGGLGLDGGAAAKALAIIEEAYKLLHSSDPKPSFGPGADRPAVKNTAVKTMALPNSSKKDNSTAAPLPEKARMETPGPAKPAVSKKIPIIQVEKTPIVPPPAKPKPAAGLPVAEKRAVTPPLPVRREAFLGNKRAMEDVKKPTPTAVGQSDELGLLTIEDLRQLNDPAAATLDFYQDIARLGKESRETQARAIRSFRESELFKDYVRIVQESLAKGKKLAEALADPNLNPNKLTQDEFFAISSLNSRLQI